MGKIGSEGWIYPQKLADFLEDKEWTRSIVLVQEHFDTLARKGLQISFELIVVEAKLQKGI